MMEIRPAEPSDMPLLRSWMSGQADAPSWGMEAFATLAQSSREAAAEPGRWRAAWIATVDPSVQAGFAVASVLILPSSTEVPSRHGVAAAECELEYLFVAPEMRRRGVARALVERIAEWGCSHGAREIWLEVRTSNAAALRLYERCGFTATGRRRSYYSNPSEDAVLMRRQIDTRPQLRPYNDALKTRLVEEPHGS